MSSLWYRRPVDGRWFVRCRQRPDYLWSRVVVWNQFGRELDPSEIVHHRNGDPSDDRAENLEVLTQAEHARRHGRGPERIAILDAARPAAFAAKAKVVAAQTHCKRGHPLSGDNLYCEPSGKRVCRICARERTRAWRNRSRDYVAMPLDDFEDLLRLADD